MLHQNHLISIVLPCYNGEKKLATSIESCLNQSYKNFELIIVNDCSTDASLEIAHQFAEKDSRINVLNNKINKKLPASLNIGHQHAKGDFITWTSDDNILNPNFIERLLDSLLSHKTDLVYSNFDVINEQSGFIRTHKTGPTEHILFGNKIGASFLYKKEVFTKLSGYDETLFLLEDYDFWIRASMIFKTHHLDEVLYQYRLHDESLTANIKNKNKFTEKHKKGVQKMFKKVADELSWHPETQRFLINHFLSEPINILNYIDTKKEVGQDIMSFNSNYLNKNEVIEGLNLLLRNHLLADKCNQNFKTIKSVLKEDRQLLFHPNFSKKTTVNYLVKSILK